MLKALLERLNDKGCMSTPRNLSKLRTAMELAVNAPKRYASADSPEGAQNLAEVQALERELSVVLYQRIPIEYKPEELDANGNPLVKLDDFEINRRREESERNMALDPHTVERAEELLIRLELLGKLNTVGILKKVTGRTRRSITELIPKRSEDADQASMEIAGAILSNA